MCDALDRLVTSLGRAYVESLRVLWKAQRSEHANYAEIEAAMQAARAEYRKSEAELKRHKRTHLYSDCIRVV